jgi:hypothetical protein
MLTFLPQQWTVAARNKARPTPSATRRSRPARKSAAAGRRCRRRGRAQKWLIRLYRWEGRRDRLMTKGSNVCSVAQRKSAVSMGSCSSFWRAVGREWCALLQSTVQVKKQGKIETLPVLGRCCESVHYYAPQDSLLMSPVHEGSEPFVSHPAETHPQ